jgi:hypothetical protein
MSSLKIQTRLDTKLLAIAHEQLIEHGYGEPSSDSELVRAVFAAGLSYLAGPNYIHLSPMSETLMRYESRQPSQRASGRNTFPWAAALSGASPNGASSTIESPATTGQSPSDPKFRVALNSLKKHHPSDHKFVNLIEYVLSTDMGPTDLLEAYQREENQTARDYYLEILYQLRGFYSEDEQAQIKQDAGY